MDIYQEFLFSEDFKQNLREIYPEYLQLEILKADKINFGLSNIIYKITLIILQNSKKVIIIIKFYLGDTARIKRLKEFGILNVLYKRKYPVPKPLFVSKNNSFHFLIMEFISDLSLDRLFKEIDFSQAKFYLEKMLQFQIQYHSIPVNEISDELRTIGVSFELSNQKILYMSYLDDLIKRSGLKEFLPLFDWLKKHEQKTKIELTSLVHNDFQPANMLEKNNFDIFYIDWEGYSIGDPVIDASWTIFVTSGIIGKEVEDFMLDKFNQLSNYTMNRNEMEWNFVLYSGWRMVVFAIILNDIEGVREKDPTYKERILFSYKPIIKNFTTRITEITSYSFPSIETKLDL